MSPKYDAAWFDEHGFDPGAGPPFGCGVCGAVRMGTSAGQPVYRCGGQHADRTPHWLRIVGASQTLSDEDRALGERVGAGQHRASGERGTRGAGANMDIRIKGAIGEIVVARLLGIDPQVRVGPAPELVPDIKHVVDGRTFAIEVKNGLPLVKRTDLGPEAERWRLVAWYVCVSDYDHPGTYTVMAVAKGRDIRERNQPPPARFAPRGDTAAENLWFGS